MFYASSCMSSAMSANLIVGFLPPTAADASLDIFLFVSDMLREIYLFGWNDNVD